MFTFYYLETVGIIEHINQRHPFRVFCINIIKVLSHHLRYLIETNICQRQNPNWK